jgi:hypothetical protein
MNIANIESNAWGETAPEREAAETDGDARGRASADMMALARDPRFRDPKGDRIHRDSATGKRWRDMNEAERSAAYDRSTIAAPAEYGLNDDEVPGHPPGRRGSLTLAPRGAVHRETTRRAATKPAVSQAGSPADSGAGGSDDDGGGGGGDPPPSDGGDPPPRRARRERAVGGTS